MSVPIPAKVSIAATVTPSAGVAVSTVGNTVRCYNEGTDWAFVWISSDASVIATGVVPGFDTSVYGVPIPPGFFTDYKVVANNRLNASAWTATGTATIVLLPMSGFEEMDAPDYLPAAGSSPPVVTSVRFDGLTDKATLAAPGFNVSTKKGTFCIFVTFKSAIGSSVPIMSESAATMFGVFRQNSGGGGTAFIGDDGTSLSLIGLTPCAPDTRICLLGSWDGNTGAGHLYFNDVDDLDGSQTVVNNLAIDLTGNMFFGWDGASALLNACVDHAFFHDDYLDLSITATRRKFINADLSAVDTGVGGVNVFGVPALFNCKNGDPSTNDGTSGPFTVTGTLAPC